MMLLTDTVPGEDWEDVEEEGRGENRFKLYDSEQESL